MYSFIQYLIILTFSIDNIMLVVWWLLIVTYILRIRGNKPNKITVTKITN